MIEFFGTQLHGANKHNSTVPRTNKGSFTGDGSNNRAIPHGLGMVPRIVFIIPGDVNGYFGFIVSGNQTDYANTRTAVTAADATNFYVSGVKMNTNLASQNWVAMS